MDYVNNYLTELFFKDSDLSKFLSTFDKVVTFETEKDLTLGLLRYNKISPKTAYLFKYKEEEILRFHTINMNFVIDIYFFNKDGTMVFAYKNCEPGRSLISSKQPAMYAVEVLSKENL
jgi:uncharacterized membrane protein (UPF0127 family)